jgi:hypothetical protein
MSEPFISRVFRRWVMLILIKYWYKFPMIVVAFCLLVS